VVRSWTLAGIAVAAGLAIAYVDSRPAWDDSGVTAGALSISAFAVAFLAGRRPWLWALLVGGWVPAIEFGIGGHPASFIALVFVFVGAYAGHGVSRLLRGRPGPTAASGDNRSSTRRLPATWPRGGPRQPIGKRLRQMVKRTFRRVRTAGSTVSGSRRADGEVQPADQDHDEPTDAHEDEHAR
jgi:hypothetical protein